MPNRALAGLLGRPEPVGMRGHAQDVQVAIADLQSEQDVGAAASPRSRRGKSRPRACRWPGCARTAASWCRCGGSAPVGSGGAGGCDDRRGADTIAEFEQLALDPPIAPARVVSRHPRHQRGKDVVDRWPSRPVRLGPLAAHEAAMPTQDGARSDQTMATQAAGMPPDEGGEHGPVGPVHTWSRVGSAEDSDLMTQHEHLHLLRRRTCGPAAGPAQAPAGRSDTATRSDTTVIVPERRSASLTAGQRTCTTFWNPTLLDIEWPRLSDRLRRWLALENFTDDGRQKTPLRPSARSR